MYAAEPDRLHELSEFIARPDGGGRGATGWEFGDIVWEITPSGKLIFFSKKQPRERYQLNLGGTSELLDVHKTCQNLDRTKTYQTVFAMGKDDLPKLLQDIGEPMFQALGQLHRPLRLGWLHHRRMALVQRLILKEADARRLARRRRRRLVIDEEALRSNVVSPEFLEDIYDFEDGAFLLLQLRRGSAKFVGVATETTNALGVPVLQWIKLRDGGKLLEAQFDLFIRSAGKYAIPESDYHKYPFLQPTVRRLQCG